MENEKHKSSQEITEAPSEISQDESDRVQREIVTHSEEFRAFMMQSGFPGMEISSKITPEHIDKMLATDDKKVDVASKDRHEDRLFKLAIVVIGIVAVVVLCVFFKDDVESLQKIIFPLISLLVGAIGGYGFGKTQKDKSDD